jgi:ABC-type transport system involved in cytochrome c biogenesis permease subunit
MGKFLLLTLITLLSSFSTFAQVDFCTKELETYPTRSGGRIKPLYVLATDTIKFITGETKIDDLSATEAFCKLSLKAFGMPLELPVKIRVDHVEVKKLLRMKDGDHSLPVNEAMDKIGILETELAQQKENNSYKKEMTKVKQRLDAYRAIVEARLWTVPEPKGDSLEFISLGEFLTEPKIAAAKMKSDNPVNYLFAEAKDHYVKTKGDDYLLELRYFKLNLFMWAMIATLLAAICFVAFKNRTAGTVFTVITIALQITAVTMRVMISGRGPVTNMYETVMFSGLGALVIGCIISLVRKEIAFVLAGLCYNVLTLMMMKLANGMLDPGISPLVPVLRDNFWLSTHVTTVILSYAALSLSWLIANGLMIRDRFFNVTSAEYRYGVDLIYTCIKCGVVMLAAGIILGGVWADYSWGRFWGWDPKETWSLIVLMVYIAILHGKSTSWIPPQRFVPLVAGAFMTVMMAWFGVNYILASGLHSYGFSEGGAVFLGSFFAIQIAVLILGTVKRKVA